MDNCKNNSYPVKSKYLMFAQWKRKQHKRKKSPGISNPTNAALQTELLLSKCQKTFEQLGAVCNTGTNSTTYCLTWKYSIKVVGEHIWGYAPRSEATLVKKNQSFPNMPQILQNNNLCGVSNAYTNTHFRQKEFWELARANLWKNGGCPWSAPRPQNNTQGGIWQWLKHRLMNTSGNFDTPISPTLSKSRDKKCHLT